MADATKWQLCLNGAARLPVTIAAVHPITCLGTTARLRPPAGRYDLTAVLTHKGRSADSGHYVAWVKQPDGKWIQFDDDKARQLASDSAPLPNPPNPTTLCDKLKLSRVKACALSA
jgi:Ubiquitin carboxyl-terminal hydrolase